MVGLSYLRKMEKTHYPNCLSKSTTTSTRWFRLLHQQYVTLLNKGIKKPNVGKQFVIDIVQFIQHLQAEAHDIILIFLMPMRQ
jgi:hypothetical protein